MRKYTGTYTIVNKKVIENEDLKTITSMVENELIYICSDSLTWRSLYYYEKDQTYWLLSHKGREDRYGSEIKVLTEIDVTTAMRFKAECQAKKNV